MDAAQAEYLSNRLRGLLVQLADRLTNDQAVGTTELIDAGEFGLALEFIADSLSEEERAVSEIERREMTLLVGEMGMDDRVQRALALCPLSLG
jgi:hypothetical protein